MDQAGFYSPPTQESRRWVTQKTARVGLDNIDREPRWIGTAEDGVRIGIRLVWVEVAVATEDQCDWAFIGRE